MPCGRRLATGRIGRQHDGRYSRRSRSPFRRFEAAAAGALLRHLCAARPTASGNTGVWYPHTFEAAALARGASLPKDYWTGHAAGEFFEKTHRHTFRVREYRSASAALDAFFAGPTISECGGAIAAAQWQVVRSTLGRAKFDAIFGSAHSPTCAMLRMRIPSLVTAYEPLAYFVDWGPTARSRRGFDPSQARIGDLYYIQGVPHYEAKHPDGFGRGYNVLYVGNNSLGEPLFAGFDLQSAHTEHEICALLVACYNEPRTSRGLSYIKHSPCPSAYDLQSAHLTETLSPDGSHAVGILAGTQRRMRFDRLWRARDMPAIELAARLAETLAPQRERHVANRIDAPGTPR